MPKAILNEEKAAIQQLKYCLETGLLISSKGIRSWILARERIFLQKTRMLYYLKLGGIE